MKMLLAAGLTGILVLPAHGQTYVSVGGNLGFLNKVEARGTATDGTTGETARATSLANFGTEWGVSAALGRKIDFARIEVEGHYAKAQIRGSHDTVEAAAGPVRDTFDRVGTLAIYSIGANAFFDFDAGLSVMPYAGVGAAWSHITYPLTFFPKATGSTWTFMGEAGFAAPITEHISAVVSYRYSFADLSQLSARDIGGLHRQQARLAVRYWF